jgi:hypothetical protein
VRDTIIGAILAVILLGSLFAAAHYAPRDLSSSSAPAQVGALRPGFVGVQRNGAWTLECMKKRQVAPWITRIIVAGAKSKGVQSRRPGRARLCHVITRIGGADSKSGWIEIIFSLEPKMHFLTALLRLAPDLATPGEYLTLHLNTGDQRARVLFCGPSECLAVPVVRPEDDGAKMKTTQAQLIASSKTAALSFPAGDGARARLFSIRTEGLQTAIAAMQRMTEERHHH